MTRAAAVTVLALTFLAGGLVLQFDRRPLPRPAERGAAATAAAAAPRPAPTGAGAVPTVVPTSAPPTTPLLRSAAPRVPVTPPTPPGPAAACSIAFGLYQRGVPWSLDELSAREQGLSRRAAIAHWYVHWGDETARFNPALLERIRGHGSLSMVTWEPWAGPPARPQENPFPLRQIARGAFDAYIDAWAVGLRTYQRPVLLRFAHEMDGDWYPWGAGVNGNTPADYIAAYRHVHDRFREHGVGNIQWVWSPNGDSSGTYPAFEAFYPGDAYVDWLAADVYNWGTTKTWSAWRPLDQLFGRAYNRLAAIHPSKPVMLAELASTEQGGDKAQWITEAARGIPQRFPRVRAVVWYNESTSEYLPYALQSSPAALAAAHAAFGNSPYCLTLPF